jgi:Protein of unknown function (DUF2786)
MLSQEERAKIAKKIQALLAKTKESGCTEDEALSAAMLAAKLQAEYNINHTEAELLQEGFSRITLDWASQRKQFIEERILKPVAHFTSTRGFVVRPKGPCIIRKQHFKTVFCGLKVDVLFAVWLFEALRDFIANGGEFYVTMASAEGRLRRGTANETFKSFAIGACARIVERLAASKEEDLVLKATGNALVIMNKQALIAQYLRENSINLEPSRALTNTAREGDAYYAGRAAGDTAGLNKPVNGGQGVRAIKCGKN